MGCRGCSDRTDELVILRRTLLHYRKEVEQIKFERDQLLLENERLAKLLDRDEEGECSSSAAI